MIEAGSYELKPLNAIVAKDYLQRGGWTREEAVLILNGLDPTSNLYIFEQVLQHEPMLEIYWMSVQSFLPGERVISVSTWLEWAIHGTSQNPRQQPLTYSREFEQARKTGEFALLESRIRYSAQNRESENLMWINHPDDPEPKSPWYTPARYFARQLVRADPALMTKRKSLAQKIQLALADHRIFKRGGSKPPEASSIMNALSNINLSA